MRHTPLRLAARALLLLLPLACGPSGPDDRAEVAVRVGFVGFDRAAGAPLVVLEEAEGARRLPIWIGVSEARSIAAEMGGETAIRPNTHDLAKRLLDRLEGTVERAVVTELRDGTYYALLFVRAHGELLEIDSRPSDAIAIALRVGAPLFVRPVVFEDAALPDGDDEPEGPRIRL